MSKDQPAAENMFLQQAIAHHRAGEYGEAEARYIAVLQEEPGHAVANHSLGLLLAQQGRIVEGLPYFIAALNSDAGQGQYWLNYIDALYLAGRLEEARQTLELARQHGLSGEQVDSLARQLGDSAEMHKVPPAQRAGPSYQKIDISTDNIIVGDFKCEVPTHQEVDALVALFGQHRYEEVEKLARSMTKNFPQYEFGWKALGAVYKQLGRVEDALAPMQRAAELSSGDIEAHYNLGVVLQELDRLKEAEKSYRDALDLDADYADAHANLGVVLHRLDKLSEAEASYRFALDIRTDYVETHFNLGRVLTEIGKPEEAEASFRSVLLINPEHAEAWFELGKVLKVLGRLEEAIEAYQKGLHIKPQHAEVHYNLGNLFKDMDRTEEAEGSYRMAIQIDPGLTLAHYNLGNVLLDCKRLEEAEASYRLALNIKPDFLEGLLNLGNVFLELKRLGEACTCYRKSLQIDPENIDALVNLGAALFAAGLMNEAEESFKRAISIKPDEAELHCGLGRPLLGMGRLSDAIKCFQRALEIKPDYAVARSNLIFTQDMMANFDTAYLQIGRKKWDDIHAAHLGQGHTHEKEPHPERKLRIGYVSGDLCNHVAAKIFGAMLFNYNPIAFEIFAYSNSLVEDEVSHKFQQSASHWRKIINLSDDSVADMIRQDGIDILVDLSGHSAGNRLLVFARKPAPIQITAWGWGGGTGMKSMDVYLADPVLVPPEEKCLFAENVRYLPNAVGTYITLEKETPAVNVLPALENNFITFGSFNRIAKVSDLAFEAWEKVLLSIPNSRLVLKSGEFNDPVVGENVLRQFALIGIDPARITLMGRSSWQEYMMAYSVIDISLDPFPQSGGVTAMEGLMMGVPMITLRWPTVPGRLAASIMTTLGLNDWIAESPEQYVEIAAKKALNLQSLSDLRQKLRGIFTSSVIGDHKAYTLIVEREYRTLWREWCKKQTSRELNKNNDNTEFAHKL